MKRVAVVGNIASGKSTVQKYLKELGYKTADTDDMAHELLTVDNNKLYEFFKNFDVFENGEFSRKKVANLVFADTELKKRFEAIIHAQIVQKIQEFFDDNKDDEYLFVAIPLLFEAGMEYLFDKILFVYCDDKIRFDRLLKRNGNNVEDAKLRFASQESQESKVSKSDYVIYNNGTLEDLKTAIIKLLP